MAYVNEKWGCLMHLCFIIDALRTTEGSLMALESIERQKSAGFRKHSNVHHCIPQEGEGGLSTS